HLIRKPEVVDVAFLLRAPAAAPGEIERVRPGRGRDVDRSHEIRTAGDSANHDLVDLQIGLGRQQLCEEPAHFDSRYEGLNPDAHGRAAGKVGRQIRLEALRRARLTNYCIHQSVELAELV